MMLPKIDISSPKTKKILYWVFGILVGVIVIPLFTLAKITSLFFLILLFIATVTYPFYRRGKVLFVLLILTAFFSLLPVDVSWRDEPGPPRFAEVIYGIPGSMEKVEQDGAILGGCTVMPGSPIWIWVW